MAVTVTVDVQIPFEVDAGLVTVTATLVVARVLCPCDVVVAEVVLAVLEGVLTEMTLEWVTLVVDMAGEVAVAEVVLTEWTLEGVTLVVGDAVTVTEVLTE